MRPHSSHGAHPNLKGLVEHQVVTEKSSFMKVSS